MYGNIFWVEFQRVPLKFHTKYITYTSKDMFSVQHWNFKELLDLGANTHLWNATWPLQGVGIGVGVIKGVQQGAGLLGLTRGQGLSGCWQAKQNDG